MGKNTQVRAQLLKWTLERKKGDAVSVGGGTTPGKQVKLNESDRTN